MLDNDLELEYLTEDERELLFEIKNNEIKM
jgi:hypothetical protein